MTVEEITSQLEEYEANPNMITDSIYSPSADEYADNQMPFTQVHLHYLQKHKNVNAMYYLSNLRIMITKR
ncbi:MAG: hypothetical protein ACHQTE_00300 [Candidatus Saccharimonadales bacterium]